MKIKVLTKFMVLSVNFIIGANSIYAAPPQNLTQAKFAIVDYYQSGQFESDVNNQTHNAIKYLQQRLKVNSLSPHPHKLAIVFDIDDTCLSNFFDYQKDDFAHTHKVIIEGFKTADAKAIPGVLDLYNFALKNRVHIFLVSGRAESYRTSTISNLHTAGFYGWDALLLAKDDETKMPAQIFKTAIRERLTKENYYIILNVGDQDSDFIGGYAEKDIRIPNPLYSLTIESKRQDSRQ